MQKEDKERVVEELTERLKSSETLLVADYRGLTMPQIDGLRDELAKHGARFQVVKNTLTRRAAEAAGADALLPLLEGPSAIAFIEAEGDPAAVAKALAAAARDTRVLEIRGGVMQARTLTADEVDALSKLPSIDVLRGQVVGAILGPLNAILGLVNAPLQNLHGLIDARIEQLGGADAADVPSAASAESAPATEPEAEAQAEAEPIENQDETSPQPAAEGKEE
ncbi:MAG TPA: 50S ribosomal protein L10 [Gaiellaceae bacterium]